MKSFYLPFVASLVVLLLTGCEEMRFAKYSGQQKAWPTGSSFGEDSFDGIPVFRGWPERKYEVLGHIEFDSAGVDWNKGDIKQAAAKAKALGGDALIMVPKGQESGPAMASLRNDMGIDGSRQVAVVVKWM